MAEEPIRDGGSAVGVVTDERGRFEPTRRQVLLGTGVVIGGAALASAPFLSGLIASLSRVLRPAVGVVAPPAARYPGLLDQLAAGVTRGLAANGQAAAPVFARTSVTSAPSSVAAAARRLVERERVDVVLVYANPTQAGMLGDLAQESGVPVVIVDPGAHIVTSAESEPRVLSHSLGYWQGVWALGSWSARAVGPRAYVISSLYESGFDVLASFEHGLGKAGGSVVGTSITHVRPGDVTGAVAKAAASGADTVFLACSGSEADDILKAVAADKAASRKALLLPGLSAGRLVAAPGLSAFTALTWPAASKDAFEMLGEDVASLVAAAVHGGRAAIPAGATTLAGARGHVELDLATGRTDVPVRVHRASVTAGRVAYEPVAVETNTAAASRFADAVLPAVRTGWIDVYGSAM